MEIKKAEILKGELKIQVGEETGMRGQRGGGGRQERGK